MRSLKIFQYCNHCFCAVERLERFLSSVACWELLSTFGYLIISVESIMCTCITASLTVISHSFSTLVSTLVSALPAMLLCSLPGVLILVQNQIDDFFHPRWHSQGWFGFLRLGRSRFLMKNGRRHLPLWSRFLDK